MVEHNNLELLAISDDGKGFLVPGILDNCPDFYKTVQNFLNYNNKNKNDELLDFIGSSNLNSVM